MFISVFLIWCIRYLRIDFNVPKLDRHNTRGAAFIGCLVVSTPCSNCVADMVAIEFDLCIVAYYLKLEVFGGMLIKSLVND